jgi:exopolysaccharide production protein ExoQ
MPQLILFGFLLLAFWLIKRDIAMRPGVSSAIWIPTLWIGIIASRPISLWTGLGGSMDTLDGSPVDRMFYLTMIIAALITLSRRYLDFGWLIARGWPVFVFYGFLLLSVLWANSLEASFKRWVKETGNILIVLVILTEARPLEAIRAVFVRCGLLLIPLSLIFIRYFPELGRRYSQHTGAMESIGVTMQKNSLGTMMLTCGIVLIWDWIERTREKPGSLPLLDRILIFSLAGITVWLFDLCDSKTSMLSLGLAGIIIAAIRIPIFHKRISAFGLYAVFGAAAFFTLDRYVGITEAVVTAMGRDMTFTGRTEVWRELFKVGTDPLLGTGFMSFWDDPDFKSKLPKWVAFSAHNGYIEVYLAGGMIGVGFLILMLLGTGAAINRDLRLGGSYAVVRFAVLVATLVANFAESNFACMTPLGFLFLLMAIGYGYPPRPESAELATVPDAAPVLVEAEPTEPIPANKSQFQ